MSKHIENIGKKQTMRAKCTVIAKLSFDNICHYVSEILPAFFGCEVNRQQRYTSVPRPPQSKTAVQTTCVDINFTILDRPCICPGDWIHSIKSRIFRNLFILKDDYHNVLDDCNNDDGFSVTPLPPLLNEFQ